MTASDFQAVVRSAGERTAGACTRLMQQLLGKKHVHAYESDSLEQALHAMCALGLEGGRRWTISVDADVLVHRELIQRVTANLPTDERVFHVNGIVADKFSMRIRSAGVRIFRTERLADCRQAIPPRGACQRPETEMVDRVERQGLRSGVCRDVLGIHDFEQSYRDLVRKALLHAKKHQGWSELIPAWLSRSAADRDYAVTAMAFFEGMMQQGLGLGEVSIETILDKVMQRLELAEKPPLDEQSAGFDCVDSVLAGEPWTVAEFVVRQWQPRSRYRNWLAKGARLADIRKLYPHWWRRAW